MVHTLKYTHTHKHAHTPSHIQLQTHTHIHTHTYTHTISHTYPHRQTHTQTHPHTQTHTNNPNHRLEMISMKMKHRLPQLSEAERNIKNQFICLEDQIEKMNDNITQVCKYII